jgi:mannose/fructose/N-acetylgalactosamine-specific phosphotransferase system component IIC
MRGPHPTQSGEKLQAKAVAITKIADCTVGSFSATAFSLSQGKSRKIKAKPAAPPQSLLTHACSPTQSTFTAIGWEAADSSNESGNKDLKKFF